MTEPDSTTAEDAMLVAARRWQALLDEVEGTVVDSQATAGLLTRAVLNATTGLTVRELVAYAGLCAINLLDARGFVHAEPEFFRHLIDRQVHK